MQTSQSRMALLPTLLFALLALFITFTVLNQSNPARKWPARDYGIYLYTGGQILEGHLPYETAWESKPPGIFYVDALALWLGRGTRWGVWAVEAVSLLAAIFLSFGLMRRLWGTWAALFGVLAWTYGLNWSLMGGNLTEEYPLPLHFLALWLFPALIAEKRRWFIDLLLGVLFGLCFLFRPNNAVMEAAIIFTLSARRLSLRDIRGLLGQLAWIAVGTALPLGITAAWFQAHGLLRELLEASVLYNLVYSGTPLSASSPIQIGSQVLGPALWVAAAGYVAAALRLWTAEDRRWWYVLLLIGFPMSIFLSDLAKRNYAHYFMNWLPFIALLAGLAYDSLKRLLFPRMEDTSRMQAAGLVAAILLTAAFFVASGMVEDTQKALSRMTSGEPALGEVNSPLSIYINERTEPGEEVLFWGGYPGENFMSKRKSPVAPLFYPLYLRSDISSRLEARFLSDLKAHPPAVIVDMGDEWALSLDPQEREQRRAAGVGWMDLPSNLEQVFAFIDRNYVPEGKFRGFGIYRLKGSG